MSPADLSAFRNTLAVGARVNVMPPDIEHSMVREVTKVEERTEYGKRWLVWHWKREGSTPWGTADCGYGGQQIEARS